MADAQPLPALPTGQLPSGLVTFMFTDIVNSTKLKGLMPGETSGERQDNFHDQIKLPHARIIFACVQKRKGVIVEGTGDGFFIAFPDAELAVLCGLEIQEQLKAANIETPEGPLQIRIGLNTGQATSSSAGYTSSAADKAARVQSKAGPGQVFLSHETHTLVKGKVRGLASASVGIHDLKGLGSEELVNAFRPCLFETTDTSPVSLSSIMTRIAVSKLFGSGNKSPDTLIGRDQELASLHTAWSGAKKRNIVTIVAWGGVGKTSLVAHWAAAKLAESEHGGVERYFDWSFYSQGTRREGDATGAAKAASADLFLKEALEFFGAPSLASSNAGAWQKGERLAQLIAQQRTLIILDGLEPLQDARTGELRDDGLRALLRGLAAHNHGLCLVTTRQQLPDLNTWHQTTAPEWRLAPLTNEAGAALLTNLGVKGTDPEKRDLSANVKGHALTLTLLGNYLRKAHHGDIRRVDLVDFQKVNGKEQGHHAFSVIAAYERWFEKNNCRTELAILRMLGLFDRPATPDCLAALRDPPIPSFTDMIASLSETDWNAAVAHLVELGLVEEQPWEPRSIVGYSEEEARIAMKAALPRPLEIGEPRPITAPETRFVTGHSLDAHPLIREYFAKEGQEMFAPTWKTAHSQLFAHLLGRAPYWPEGLDGLQPLYQAVAHGCEAGRYSETLDVYRSRILRGESYYSGSKLGLILSNLATTACFFSSQWDLLVFSPSRDEEAWIYKEAGTCLRDLGRFSEALSPLKKSFKLLTEGSDHELAARCAGKLCELQIALGEISEAETSARFAVRRSDQTPKPFLRCLWRSRLADALHSQGRKDEASRILLEANAIHGGELATDNASVSYDFHLAVGFHRHDLNLSEAERVAWQLMLKINLNATNEERRSTVDKCLVTLNEVSTHQGMIRENWIFRAGLDNLLLGRASLYASLMGWGVKEPKAFDEAVTILSQANRRDYLPCALLSRAWLRAAQGQPSLAQADLDEAWQIAERGPMRLHLADIHLHRARLFFREAKYPWESPAADLAAAEKLINTCGYHRRDEELADAKRAILGQ